MESEAECGRHCKLRTRKHTHTHTPEEGSRAEAQHFILGRERMKGTEEGCVVLLSSIIICNFIYLQILLHTLLFIKPPQEKIKRK